MTTIDTITTDQIRTLRDEAGAHGDLEMVAICQRALAGDAAAIAECVRVIRSAELNAEAPDGRDVDVNESREVVMRADMEG